VKIYRGERGPGGPRVTADGRRLDPTAAERVLSLRAAFAWGAPGNGALQLALALLLDASGDPGAARDQYRDFARQFVAGFGDRWELTDAQVREWLSLSRTRAG
jgi:hypothetical protein